MSDAFAFQVLSGLPSTSDAFTRLHHVRFSVVDGDNTGSPPRKSARFDQDQETPSARSKGKGKAKAQPIGPENALASKARVFRIAGVTPRALGELPNAYINDLIPIIRRSVGAVLDLGPNSSFDTPNPFEHVFQACHVLVSLKGQGSAIYDDVRMQLEKCVGRIFKEAKNSTKQGMSWLSFFMSRWEWYESKLSLLQSLLIYLDRLFVAKDPGRIPAYQYCLGIIGDNSEMGRKLWRSALTADSMFHIIIQSALSEWVTSERDEFSLTGEVKMDVDHSERVVIKSLIDHLSLLGLYADYYESPYILVATQYYHEESRRLLGSLSTPKYVLHSSSRIEEEERRVLDCSPAFSGDRIIGAIEDQLIRPHIESLSTAVGEYIGSGDVHSLSKMYELYSRVQGLPTLRLAFKDFVRTSVVGIVKNKEQDANMVASLIEFKQKVDAAVSLAFHVDHGPTIAEGSPRRDLTSEEGEASQFAYAARDAFESGFASRKNKPAEMIAKYLDAEMRHGQGSTSDQEFQKKLDDALGLYGFTPDHDVFRIFYMRALAKRLLLRRSASDDFEKSFLTKLAKAHDPAFDNGTKMFSDLETSRTLTSAFHQSYPNDKHLSVMVIQPSAWPTYSPVSVTLPYILKQSLDDFDMFYPTRHKDKKLTWVHSLGTVIMIARFPKGEKELSVSLFQAVVLLLFEDGIEKLQYTEIQDRTNIPAIELKRTLQSLALGKKRVLVKTPTSKEVKDSDVFLFNSNFEDKSRNIRINNIQVQETAEENQATSKYIDQDRSYQLDASIVRIMKGKKKLPHQDLVVLVIDAVKAFFVPEVAAIKKSISKLVEQDFLSRDEKTPNVYHYVA